MDDDHSIIRVVAVGRDRDYQAALQAIDDNGVIPPVLKAVGTTITTRITGSSGGLLTTATAWAFTGDDDDNRGRQSSRSGRDY